MTRIRAFQLVMTVIATDVSVIYASVMTKEVKWGEGKGAASKG